jgi:hypothetical protein
MSPNPKSKVVSTGKIDGGAYRLVELPDGSGRVEEWKAGAWVTGGASISEVFDAPPVSAKTAADFGIPLEDLQIDRSGAPYLVMVDPPGLYSDTLSTWERYLSEVKGLPEAVTNKQSLIEEAEWVIARKRQEVEKASGDRNIKALKLKPDYGLRLLKDGFSRTADLFFYEFRLYSISVLGIGDYSTMVEHRYEGEMHALSLDFNHTQLEQILVGADPTLAAFIRAELKNPFPRTIELDGYVRFAVRARLGSLQMGTHEQFIPLVAQEIFAASTT